MAAFPRKFHSVLINKLSLLSLKQDKFLTQKFPASRAETDRRRRKKRGRDANQPCCEHIIMIGRSVTSQEEGRKRATNKP